MRKIFCPLFTLSCAIAWPQAVVEHATATAASSTGTAAAGKSIGGVFGSLSKKLDKAGKFDNTSASTSKTAATVSTASNQVPKEQTVPIAPTAAKFVDPTQLMIGLDVEELIRRCGEPSMSITQVRDSQSVETYWYNGAHHDVLEVTLRDGIVTSVTLKVTQPHER